MQSEEEKPHTVEPGTGTWYQVFVLIYVVVGTRYRYCCCRERYIPYMMAPPGSSWLMPIEICERKKYFMLGCFLACLLMIRHSIRQTECLYHLAN